MLSATLERQNGAQNRHNYAQKAYAKLEPKIDVKMAPKASKEGPIWTSFSHLEQTQISGGTQNAAWTASGEPKCLPRRPWQAKGEQKGLPGHRPGLKSEPK